MDYVIKTILKQIKHEILCFEGFSFFYMNDVTLAIYKKRKALFICYDESSDLYDLDIVTFDTMNPLSYKVIERKEIRAVHCDDLVGIITEHFSIQDANYKDSYDSYGDADYVTCIRCGKPIEKGYESFVVGIHQRGPIHTLCLFSEREQRMIKDKIRKAYNNA